MPKEMWKVQGVVINASQLSQSGLQIEAIYKLDNQVLLSQTAISGEDGRFTLEFTSDLFANLSPNDFISVEFEVFQENRRLVSTGRIDRLAQKDVKVEILVETEPEEPAREDGKKKVQTPAEPVQQVENEGKKKTRKKVKEPADEAPDGKKPVGRKVTVQPAKPSENASVELFIVQGLVKDAQGRPLAGLLGRAYDYDLSGPHSVGSPAITDQYGHFKIQYTEKEFARADKGTADLVFQLFDTQGSELRNVTVTDGDGTVLKRLPVRFGSANSPQETPIWMNAPKEATVHFTVHGRQHVVISEYERYLHVLRPLAENLPLGSLETDQLAFLQMETEISSVHLFLLRDAERLAEGTQVPGEIFYGLVRQRLPRTARQLSVEAPDRLRKALERSIEAKIISSGIEVQLDKWLAALREWALDQSFASSQDAHRPGIGEVLNTTLLDEDNKRRLAEFMRDYDGPEENFWERLADMPGFGDENTRQEARFAIESDRLVLHHLPMLKAIQGLRREKGLKEPRQLVQLEEDDIVHLISLPVNNALPEIPLGFETPKAYAQAVMQQLEDAYPTPFVAHRLINDPEFGSEELKVFFDSHPDFTLEKDDVDTVLHSETSERSTNSSKLKHDLKRMKRVFGVVPPTGRVSAMKELMRNKIESAANIMDMGEVKFHAQMDPSMGKDWSDRAFRRARKRQKQAELVGLAIRDKLSSPDAVSTSQLDPEDTAVAEVRGLFGSQNGCECEHCRSVYSPTAYFVDLLQFLERSSPAGEGNPLTVLIGRRPDIPQILCNCTNANIPVPVIDLVNEILEEAIAPIPEPDAAAGEEAHAAWLARYQTTGTAEERRALPEHEHAPAYDALRAAVFPWILPFDPDLAKADLLAAHLGLKLHAVYAMFKREAAQAARAHLRINPAEWQAIVTAESDLARLAQLWGVSDIGELRQAVVFMHQSGLEYQDLETLAKTSFLAVAGASGLEISFSGDACDVDDRVVSWSSENILDRAHRFLRLRKKLGWSITGLDDMLAGLGAADVDSAALVSLSEMILVAGAQHIDPLKFAALDRASLGRELGLNDREIGLLIDLSGEDPFAPTARRLPAMAHLMETDRLARLTRIKLQELAYILLHQDQVPAVFDIPPARLEAFLLALRELWAVEEPKQMEAAQEDIRKAVANFSASLSPDLSEADRTMQIAEFRRTTESALRRHLLEATIVASLATFLQLPVGQAAKLVRREVDASGAVTSMEIVHSLANPDMAAIDDIASFVQTDTIHSNPTETDTGRLLIRLDKSARILRALRLDETDIEAIRLVRAENAFLDFNQLPYTSVPGESGLFQGLQRIIQAIELRDELPRADENLFDLLQAAAEPGAYADLSVEETFESTHRQTGWSPALLVALTAAFGLIAADFRLANTYRRMMEAVRLLRRLGIEPDVLGELSRPEMPSSELAVKLFDLVRSRYPDTSQWWKALTPIMDEWREKKRDALLAHLIHTDPNLQSPEECSARHLADVEMSSCMLTSRIKQALAAVQLFIQRGLMNLEPDANFLPPARLGETEAEQKLRHLAEQHWRQFDLRRYYRWWEAGRKICIDTPNWLDPHYWEGMSPFAREFENELLQGEVTMERVENAFMNYLRRLYEVSRLDVRSFYQEEDQTLHVLARTDNVPHKFFYRYRSATGSWSPWEKVDLDIDVDQEMLVKRNGRLFLFWPSFRDLEIDGQKKVEISMLWSEYANGRWTPKKGGKQQDVIWTLRLPQRNFTFRVDATADKLDILLYQQLEHWDELSGDEKVTFSAASRGFTFDDCANKFRKFEVRPHRVLLRPPHVVADGMLLEEEQAVPDAPPLDYPLVVQQLDEGIVLVDTMDDPPTFIDFIGELVEGGGLGVVLAALMGGEAVLPILDQLRLLGEQVDNTTLLRVTPGTFEIVPAHQARQFLPPYPFFFQDQARTYLVTPRHDKKLAKNRPQSEYQFSFEIFYHPFICDMLQRAETQGIQALLRPPAGDSLDRQQMAEPLPGVFKKYAPDGRNVLTPYPRETFDFDLKSSYAIYNWEFFFHLRLSAAVHLTQSGHYDDARRMFRTCFDPTDASDLPAPQRFWKFRPFFEEAARPEASISDLMTELASGSSALKAQIAAWEKDPFNPHVLARMRIRAYMTMGLMKYIDNDCFAADELFSMDRIETINEATQWYILAAGLLGKRPTLLPAQESDALNFAQMRGRLDAFSNLLVEIESRLPEDAGSDGDGPTDSSDSTAPGSSISSVLSTLYFCIPPNEKLLAYHDKIALQLSKIRNCMNIEGQDVERLLWDMPIDPALFVRARAAGLDLRQVMQQTMQVNLPASRYPVLVQKALEICSQFSALATAHQVSLEKSEAEEFTLLRSRHEIALLESMRQVRKEQVSEARETTASFQKVLEGVHARRDFYSTHLREDNLRRLPQEKQQFVKMAEAQQDQNAAGEFEIRASIAHMIPTVSVSAGGPSVSFGGSNVGSGLNAFASNYRFLSSQKSFEANQSALQSTFLRREEDWAQQVKVANIEAKQVEKQLLASEIRLAVAEKELSNIEQQIEQAREVEEFHKNKSAGFQFHDQSEADYARLCYQFYQLAYDMARQAERASQHELGLTPEEFSFITFRPYNKLQAAVLVEELRLDLSRLDVAHRNKKRRGHELIKNVSLRQWNPRALIALRETGACTFLIPEALIDLDLPGQCKRLIKSVSVTIACVVGPYTSVGARLTLESSSIRRGDTPPVEEYYSIENLETLYLPEESIALSHGQNDSGLFELNFNGELLNPFEGAGLISRWRLEFPSEYPSFDRQTMTDVVLHIRFVAKPADAAGEQAAKEALRELVSESIEVGEETSGFDQLFSLRHEFPTEWHRFLHPLGDGTERQAITVNLSKDRFPYPFHNREINFNQVSLLVTQKTGATPAYDVGSIKLSMAPGNMAAESPRNLQLWKDVLIQAVYPEPENPSDSSAGGPGEWTISAWEAAGGRLNPELIEDILVICNYTLG